VPTRQHKRESIGQQALIEDIVVGNEHTTLAGGDGLCAVEGERTKTSHRPSTFAMPYRPNRLGDVLFKSLNVLIAAVAPTVGGGIGGVPHLQVGNGRLRLMDAGALTLIPLVWSTEVRPSRTARLWLPSLITAPALLLLCSTEAPAPHLAD
jgi:hypothetical protein